MGRMICDSGGRGWGEGIYVEIEILEMGRGRGGRSSKFGERLKGMWGGGVRGPYLIDGRKY